MNNPVLPSVLVSSPPLWRLQLVRILQLVGVLGGFLGGADFLQLIALMPPDIAGWLLIAGPAFAAGSKPMVLLIGDYLDDGVKNNSFKLPIILLICGLTMLLFPSCASSGLTWGVTQEGCALATYTSEDGQKFRAGPCLNETGQIDRYITEWETPETKGQASSTVKAVRFIDSKVTKFYYREGGAWIEWSSKSGLSIGPIPTT